MTIAITSTDHVPGAGWIDFGSITCDFCGQRHPETGTVETGMIYEACYFGGWSRFSRAMNGPDICPDCYRRLVDNGGDQ